MNELKLADIWLQIQTGYEFV